VSSSSGRERKTFWKKEEFNQGEKAVRKEHTLQNEEEDYEEEESEEIPLWKKRLMAKQQTKEGPWSPVKRLSREEMINLKKLREVRCKFNSL
jgi:hypothetical protein